VVFTGSSSITFWHGLGRDMAPLAVVNRGFGGSQIRDATWFAARLFPPPAPAAVVLSAGSNDLALFRSVDGVFADFERFVARVRALHGAVPVYFVSVNRAPVRRRLWAKFDDLNERVERWAARDADVRYIDASAALYGEDGVARDGMFGFDGLHMTGAGYAGWTSVIRPRLLADLGGAR
jgi:lysophospholipase L1-like esterase